jgi:CubicO group peptidase (beta-lactamase class C family)
MSWRAKGLRMPWRAGVAARCAAAAVTLIGALGWTSLQAAPPTGPAIAAPSPAAVSAPTPTPTHPLTATDVEAWLDGLVPIGLRDAEAPGAVIVVVKDGQVLMEKGYGFANYERQIPVDPRRTLFRPGSISKLFTWTAVMQLVEAGKLNLDTDVNTYLDFKIPAYHGIPVTLRQLMTHRAGFSETARDLLTYGKAPDPLGVVLKRYIPPRIFAPDGGPGYSNYGASLAGYIVQRVSGEPFETYVAQHIFIPLGMNNSTFVQPLPAAMAPNMATGYETADKPGPGFEIIDMPPAGSLTTTGDDISHFMIAHLQLGRYGGAQILQPQTAQEMHTSVTRAFPDLNGNLLGFYQQNVNGHRVISHGGDTNFFHSDLNLFLDDNVGLFISVNARGKDGMGEMLRDKLFAAFADRYFPAAAPPPASTVDARRRLHHHAPLRLELHRARPTVEPDRRHRQPGRQHHRRAARRAGEVRRGCAVPLAPVQRPRPDPGHRRGRAGDEVELGLRRADLCLRSRRRPAGRGPRDAADAAGLGVPGADGRDLARRRHRPLALPPTLCP